MLQTVMKFLIKSLLIAGLILSSFCATAECFFLNQLDNNQKSVAKLVYKKGLKYDLGKTAIAIAWKESKLGRYLIRYGRDEYDRSYGIGHTVAYWRFKADEREERLMVSSFDRGMWIQKMVTNIDFSSNVMLEDIMHWQSLSEGSWFNGVAMYNSGSFVTESGKSYAEDVAMVVAELRSCDLNGL
jgi:hypothetical protein